MTLAIVVGLAAAVGAVLRYLADQAVQHRHAPTFPWATLGINISGSLLLGFVTGMTLHHGLSAHWAAVLGTGLAGGYTTWSTFAWESLALAERGALLAAGANIAASVVLCLAAAAAGLGLALI